ncbi:NIF3-like protein 1 [Varanus komodoensis]|uniref:NIF3-like protein 1 n=1 Tax=Varanus komodoensis TaxID=61221 RepID=A0A8D2JDM2_VARKO|nr:NIF3-like protein 1 [Varanus komodoensis]XP_044288001.1 NIF3-like protein 1 [Varanus komodoensis]XP_044288002.1 NIF3-like protein 1 [Varanus komodoensis]XP_044288003.1 NIF3-like protein 1 [Varanus komodoensis]XP_044288004.1 NIF3-like protein 1 [Varanus komodoensis]XP_044288005.1 NIF3-like protein 1 [Varanus komodoensis]KAF7243679.1 NIF3-like protein 1 [Varanus komodoensis]
MRRSHLKLIARRILCVQPVIDLASRSFMELKLLVSSLNDFASLSLAESWDNVGLLVEPSPPHTVNTVFLTNDLTEQVMEEAVQKKADLILSYHPPIFQPLKRVTWNTWKERLVIRALENRIGIYSPHTAYDAIPHGVNNWLAKGLGACSLVPLQPAIACKHPTEGCYRLEFSASSAEDLETVLSSVRAMPEVSLITTLPIRTQDEEQTRISLNCTQRALMQVVALLSQNSLLFQKTEILSLQKPLLEDTGVGRLCTLKEPVLISELIERVKCHLSLSHVRLALGAGKSLESPVKVVALCAGSGASVLRGTESDLYLTGEMSHHDVLDAVSRGITVILCEHSNTERGFLLELQKTLTAHLEEKICVIVSERDQDPLQVV